MRLEVAEQNGACKLWVSGRELAAIERVVATGDPLILPDEVMVHMREHGHTMVARLPRMSWEGEHTPAELWAGVQVHLVPWSGGEDE